MAIFESTGTVALTNNSTQVTGAGTNWAVNYPGVLLIIEGMSYPVASINGANSLTLAKPFSGATASGLDYTFAPLQPDNYNLSVKVNEIIDIAGDLVDASRGPAGPAGPAGATGPAGKNGDVGFGAVIGLTEYAGQPAGGSGVNLIVPVATGEPGITLTQSSQVVLPYDKPNAGIGLWIKATTSGYAITLGLTNAPLPQPEVPTEPVDLSGSSTIYGTPGTIIPLGIFVGGSNADFTVNTPEALPIRVERKTGIVVPTSTKWTMGGSGAPYAAVGDAIPSMAGFNKSGTAFDFRNGRVVMNQNAYLFTDALGLDFGSSANEVTTQTPPSFRLTFRGVVPASTPDALLINLMDYSTGGMTLGTHWDGETLILKLHRNGSTENIVSEPSALRKLGTLQTYEAEFINNPNGDGGSVNFYIDGVKIGATQTVTSKPRIASVATLESNASVGNTSISINNLEVEYIAANIGKPAVQSNYEAITDGPITSADLQALVVDARAITTNQPAYHLTYTANGIQTYDIEIVVGEMVVPAGRAYKAVLEDWSTGVGVAHPAQLVMTKPSAQNCKFEDANLYTSQPTWTEVLPQGPVPVINGIAYYCEGIRIGTYVQFQFGYDWDAATMPYNPFGDPTGKDSYMVPHKWRIEDVNGTVLSRIEMPNGEPLNSANRKPAWQGSYDGRGVAIITANNQWNPFGTTRSGVIWRSHEPVAYSQADVWKNVPAYDMRVPFAAKTGFSVNGGDARVFGDGQANGFANYRAMSWEPTTYTDIITAGANTQDPWKGSVYAADGIVPNAGIWLKYTPFNQMGRSPVTGPGGARDDRQIMPEMVAEYVRDVNAKRPHDGRSMKSISLDYLTGYVSDPFHSFENGRNRPLYKGNMRRNITMRNHYYGPGQAATPASQAYYAQGGRQYEWQSSASPLRVRVPYAGIAVDRPIFGTNMIDEAHAHQLPHWGSMLWQTPEFAFLGHRFYDQAMLYNRGVLGLDDSATEFYERGAAWKFMHTALAWKTASNNSDRLYSRAEVMDFITVDFEKFYDMYYASTPGFLNPPANIMSGGEIDQRAAVYAGAARFGPCQLTEIGVHCHDFYSGYWLSALHAANKMGFIDALKAASPKVKAVIEWLLAMHRKRAIGHVKDGLLINASGSDYFTSYWTEAEIRAAGGDVSKLHQTFAAVAAARPAPSWDTYKNEGQTLDRDGQAMDQLLAAPAIIKDLGMTGTDIDQAITIAEARFQEKLTAETAKGPGQAGSTWFKYHQVTNNRPYKP